MKTNNLTIALVVLFVFPLMLKAQWKAVRFDNVNTFEKIVTPTSSTAFVTGYSPFQYENFLLKTNDGGATWDSIGVNTPTDTFQLTELYFRDMNNGFVGGLKNGNEVLLKTIDNGITWIDITPDPSTTNSIQSVYFIDAQNGFVSDRETLYRTTNGGMNWTSKTFAMDIMDLHFLDMNNGFLSGDSTTAEAIVMKTTDGGQNWSKLLSVSDANLFVSTFYKLDFVNVNLAFTSLQNTNELFRTTDGGISWDTIVVDSVWIIRDFSFASADTGHVLSEMGQIFITTDGGKSWKLEYATDWNSYGPSIYLNSLSFIDQTGFVAGSNGLIKKYTANAATGISESDFNGNSSIYPNPFSTFTTLSISNYSVSENAHLNFALYDIFGRKVLQSEIYNPQFQIQRGNLSEGVYFYKVSDEKKETINSGKVVVE